jgi:hypothetical protein
VALNDNTDTLTTNFLNNHILFWIYYHCLTTQRKSLFPNSEGWYELLFIDIKPIQMTIPEKDIFSNFKKCFLNTFKFIFTFLQDTFQITHTHTLIRWLFKWRNQNFYCSSSFGEEYFPKHASFNFFGWVWNLNTGLLSCKPGTLLLEAHFQSASSNS